MAMARDYTHPHIYYYNRRAQRLYMIDSQQLEQLLKTTKLSSMSDIIHFILGQLYNSINFEPVQQLSYRLAELEKPKGLDSIMLEEVKALIQAMLQQKEDQIKKDLERAVHCNLSAAMEQENNKRSLREMDIIEMVAKENNKKNSLSPPQQRPINYQYQSQIECLKKQVAEIKSVSDRKLDKSDHTNLKFEMQRQLSNKMTISETEKIVQKFQREIFCKINDTNTYVQRMEYEIKKAMLGEVNSIKKEVMESVKMMELKEVKDKCAKMEKKVKKLDGQQTSIGHKQRQEASALERHKKESKQSIQQLCACIQNMDAKLKHSGTLIAKLQQSSIEHTQSLQMVLSSQTCLMEYGTWVAENRASSKNMSILWEREYANSSPEQYKYEHNKSQIIVAESGYYTIECCVLDCEYPPQLMVNGAALKLEGSEGRNSGRNSLVSTGNACRFVYRLCETVRLQQSLNKVWVKLQNSHSYGAAVLRISRMA